MKHTFLIIAALASILAGCTDMDDADIGQHQQPIIHGLKASDQEYSAVVAIVVRIERNYYELCSGTLIAPDLVLTAAHCFNSTAEFPFSDLYKKGHILVASGERIDRAEIREIEKYEIHPDRINFNHDLGIIKLKKAFGDKKHKAEVFPILEDTSFLKSSLKTDTAFTVVGFGDDEYDMNGTRRYFNGRLLDYCEPQYECKYTFENGIEAQMQPGTFIQYLEKGGACHGDSGGPILVSVDGTRYIAGVVSSGDADCAMFQVSTSVPDHAEWIQKKIKENNSCSASPLHRNQSRGSILLFFMLVLSVIYALPRFRKKIAGN